MILAIVLAIAGLACVAYGLKYVFSATKMRFHFFWFVFAVVLVAPAILMAAGAWDSIPVWLHYTVAGLFLLLVIYEAIVGAAIARHCNDQAVDGLDYIAVLGAQVLDGKPGRTFAGRLSVACDYLADNPSTLCIVCGSQGPNESIPEADAGRNYLIERGISSNRILLEARSYSTAQNLHFAAELIDPAHDSVGIVTNDYHVARSLAIARKAGMVHATGIAVTNIAHFPLNNIVRESFAWVKDVLMGNA